MKTLKARTPIGGVGKTALALLGAFSLSFAAIADDTTPADGGGDASGGGEVAIDNTASTWTGAVNNNWTDGGNWSTTVAPTSETAVTIPAEGAPEGGWVIYLGGNALAKSVAVLGDTTFQRDANVSGNGCIVVQESITTGEAPATLTLNSAFVFAGSADQPLSISCPIVSSNGSATTTSGFTSNVSGTFDVSSTISGTGTFEFRKATTLSQNLVLSDDGLTKIIFEAAPTFTGEAALTVSGSGTLVCTGFEPSNAVQTQLQDSDNWTGVCELKGLSLNAIDFNNYGNENSTVSVNGLSGYLAFSTEPKNIANVKVLEIGANGLTLNNTLSSKNWNFAAKLTGTGTMTIGTACSPLSTYTFTGDVSEFAGVVSVGSGDNRPAVVFNSAAGEDPTMAAGQIAVVSGTTLGASGLTGTVVGAGTIALSKINPSLTPTFDSTWTGEVILPATTLSDKTGVPLVALGSENGTLVLKGIDPNGKRSYITADGAINGTVRLDGNVTFNDGSSEAKYTFVNLTGTGNLSHVASLRTAATLEVTKLTKYTGELGTGGNTKLTIGTVSVANVTMGKKMVDLSDGCNLTTSPEDITVEVDDTLDPGGHKLVKADDGDLYVRVASVTADMDGTPVTTYYATLEKAAEAAIAADANVKREDAIAPAELAGWTYDRETSEFTKDLVAQVGETTYKTLAAAIDAAGTDEITLIADCNETVTLGEGQTFKPGTYAFSGVLNGEGTICYDSEPTVLPTYGDWTGTFVINWPLATISKPKPAVYLNKYGNANSKVNLAVEMTGGYLARANGETTTTTVWPEIILAAPMTFTDGYAYSGNDTIFKKLRILEGGALNMTRVPSNPASDKIIYFQVENLLECAGTITVGNYNSLSIASVSLASIPAFDANIVPVTVLPATDTLVGGVVTTPVATSIASVTLVYKEGGLYAYFAAEDGAGNVYQRVGDATTAVYMDPDKYGRTVTVRDASYEDNGDYDEYFTWNAVTRTYTLKTFVARIGMKVFETFEAAVAAADAEGVKTVYLMDDIDDIDQSIPSGWKYNTPAESETTYGTLTKSSETPTDTFDVVAKDASLDENGQFTVPEGTTKIKIGDYTLEDDDGIAIKGTTVTVLPPEVVEDEDEAIEIGATTVTLNVDLVPGLYYGVAAGTEPTLSRPATLTQYTGSNDAGILTVAKPSAAKGFFKVYVDIKK